MIERTTAAKMALEIATEAAQTVMRVYAGQFDVDYKIGDDPVTRADRESNALCCERLSRAFPGVPIVAEESDPATYAGFAGESAVWFVDPLDGTREFVARNGEFAVMIGLAEGGRATIGVVVAPAWLRAFVGIVGEGAWEVAADGTRRPIRVSSHASATGLPLLVSRSRSPNRLEAIVAGLGAAGAVAHGSAGLKGALVACGAYDMYAQPGAAGMLWDACATDALVRAAGGACSDGDGAAFDYASEDLLNARGLVASNGALHAAVLDAIRTA
ncbi:MAG: 3'(2'),5'-bisphosphate nucleotidase CysQ [Myxococcota bacterium]|nr:3'(2'),5'-bisphosphate nucleotidase CysQ [Myxococcota bacterium]